MAGDFKDHFSDRASGYAAFRPDYPAELADFLARAAPRRELVWEAGCGSGQLSIVLASRFVRVIATDASAAQIARAAPHPKIDYRVALAEKCGLPDACADLAVAAQAAHWFDLPAYYSEVRRVLHPDGLAALTVYGIHRVDHPPVNAVISRFYHETLGSHWPPERRLVETGYQTLPFPFEEIESPEMEMRKDWRLDEMCGYIETWSAVRALVNAAGNGPLDAFYRELADAWGPPQTAYPVCWPLSLRVGRLAPSSGVAPTDRR